MPQDKLVRGQGSGLLRRETQTLPEGNVVPADCFSLAGPRASLSTRARANGVQLVLVLREGRVVCFCSLALYRLCR